jgi:hypothetical protein
MTLSYTKNLHLAVPDFLTEPWHAEFAQAMDSIDEIIFHALVAQDIDLWVNSTTYQVGDLVISPDTGEIFSCAVANMSSPLPTTFTQEIAAHPTYWTPIGLRLATQAEAEAGTDNTKYMSPLRVAQAIAARQDPSTFITGDIKPTHAVVPPTGWIIWRDGTIGSAASGASIRAAADCRALFDLYYNFYSDADCPLLTSGGIVVTRVSQGSNAPAWTNNCRMSLPKIEGRVLGSCGAGAGLTGRNLGSTTGLETITPSIASMAAHKHRFTTPLTGDTDPITSWPPGQFPSNWEAAGVNAPGYLSTCQLAFEGSSLPSNNMQPSGFVNFMVKL